MPDRNIEFRVMDDTIDCARASVFSLAKSCVFGVCVFRFCVWTYSGCQFGEYTPVRYKLNRPPCVGRLATLFECTHSLLHIVRCARRLLCVWLTCVCVCVVEFNVELVSARSNFGRFGV